MQIPTQKYRQAYELLKQALEKHEKITLEQGDLDDIDALIQKLTEALKE